MGPVTANTSTIGWMAACCFVEGSACDQVPAGKMLARMLRVSLRLEAVKILKASRGLGLHHFRSPYHWRNLGFLIFAISGHHIILKAMITDWDLGRLFKFFSDC